MPVTIATQEAEIRRTAIQGQPKQIVHKTLAPKNPLQKGWWSGSRCRPWVQTPVHQKKKKMASGAGLVGTKHRQRPHSRPALEGRDHCFISQKREDQAICSSIHSFVHSFIQQTFIEYPKCASSG
jgi:hypothetical protein